MTDASPRRHVPVIAIGASAGGLEAARALVHEIPDTMHAAFLLVMHLDPSHDSMVVELLSRQTGLKVVLATDGMRPKPGVLHVIPPGVFMTVTNGTIHLSQPKSGQSVRLPFDLLLQSLAKDAGAHAACIVLSGTGTDGTKGIAAIHAAGGLVIAQDPSEAGYSGMPESAIKTGFVAKTLRTDQMVIAIDTFLDKMPRDHAPVRDKALSEQGTPPPATGVTKIGYDTILDFLAEHSAHDLSLYKRGTLERRIARRMALAGLGTNQTDRYLAILQGDRDEFSNLSADLLIHVTSFFRDPAVFEHLSTKALPELLSNLPAARPLRVWVAGCSTGEEAYSLAMACIEATEAAGSRNRIQILASDIDPEAIATARTGFYPKEIESYVSPARLARFFIEEDGGWRVTSSLRDLIVFTVADLLADPPFSKIDLVSCRNVLIYLGPEAQKRVIAQCCFALRQDGLLLLGTAEMPAPNDSCFVVQDKAARIWRRVGRSNPGDLHFAIGKREEDAASTNAQPALRRNALAELCRRIVMETYAPAAVLLNSRLDCLYFLGPTEKYLKITQGHPDDGILGMLPKALRVRFKAAAASCGPSNPRVSVSGGNTQSLTDFNMDIHSVKAGTEQLLLVCFINATRVFGQRADATIARTTGETEPTRDLEAELEATRGDLLAALHDLEQEIEAHATNAAEALSVNEEFQSTNEELLASKEELQSLNEELTALNSQLHETLERHRTTANDLQNVLYSTDVATLFLDRDLNIRFFTPAARSIFRVISTDIGRPLADLAAVAKDDDLDRDARQVLATFDPIERETVDTNGNWFLRRIQPYRAEGDLIEGVVITYLDITERKRSNAALMKAMAKAERATKAKSRFLASASHDLRQPLQSMALLHQLLGGHKRSTEGAKLAALLDQTLHSMTEMLDSMLDVNRIESGIVRPQMQPVAIGPLLQQLADEFRPQCDVKGLKLRVVPSKAWVLSDPQLLKQILRNLLSNALKYTPKGGILLGCRRRGAGLAIVVYDTGIGIPESESNAIFEAYHQANKGAGLSEQGLGLGLSIVQRLAHLMKYPLSVRSVPNRGSSFMITLPVVDPLSHEEQVAQAAPVAPPSTHQTGTILLVEDEAPLRELMTKVLTNEGHNVIAMTNAQEALAWASEDVVSPDLLLTDFDLHGGSTGLQLAQDLPDVLGEKVPTVILTGDITKDTLQGIANSSYHHVMKPVMPEVLLAMISDLLDKNRTAAADTTRSHQATGMSVHVVDDDPMIRETLRRLFEAEGWKVVTYSSAEDFLSKPKPEGAACLLVDNLLPDMDGISLITHLRSQKSFLPVVMLTGHGDAAVATAALKAGASDLIEKPASAADLLSSVRQAIEVAQNDDTKAQSHKAARKPFAQLTAREREVLALVLAGLPNKIIANELKINQRTVENHRASVMRKTGAGSLPTLVRLALAADIQSA